MSQRHKILFAALLVVLGGVVIYHWFSDRGLVTLEFDNVPAGKVIKSLERQGGIRVVTNGDLTAPISIHVKRVPVYEAADTVAVRMGGNLTVAYVGAPDSKQVDNVLKAFAANTNPGDWTAFAGGFGGGFGGGGGGGGQNNRPPRENAPAGDQTTQVANNRQQGAQPGGEGGRNRGNRGGGGGGGDFGGGGMDFGAGDPRFIEWKISEVTDRNLQAFLSQGAQKTGALFAVPKDWNPVLGKLPKSGTTRDMAKAVTSAAEGRVQEVFLITINARLEQAADNGPRFTPTVFSPQRGPMAQINQEWIRERVDAQIAALPAEEQAQAKKDMNEFRAFRDSLRNLSEEERRAKWEEFMNRADVQERMEERQAARDAKNSPDQRDARARNYLERKQAQKGSL